jgi:hypothetical protein
MGVSGYFTLNIKNGDPSGYWVSLVQGFAILLSELYEEIHTYN